MTDFTKADLDVVIPDIDRKRIEMNLSYQGMADACGVSQSTIIRVIRRQVSPTFDLLQMMAASVQYEPKEDVITPIGYTPDAYIEYLKQLVSRQKSDYERQLIQQEAQFNRIRCQDRRVIRVLAIVLGVFFLAFLAFRAIDMRVSNADALDPVDLCINCESEIEDHSQFCAWCGHEQNRNYNA